MMLTGLQIRKAREQLGWAPNGLADRARLPLKTIQRAELPESVITIRQARHIQAVLERAGVEFTNGHATSVLPLERKTAQERSP